MSVLVAWCGIALALITIGYFLFARRHPQDASGRPAGDTPTSQQFFGDTNDRPGGPGAEADGVAGRGSVAPGPSAEAGGASERAWEAPDNDS